MSTFPMSLRAFQCFLDLVIGVIVLINLKSINSYDFDFVCVFVVVVFI